MRILFACHSFHQVVGGVERMAIELMNDMVARGHEIHLLTWDRAGAQAFYPMNPAIVWHTMPEADPTRRSGMKTRMKRAAFTRALARSLCPDVAIGFQHGPFVALRLFTLGLPFPVICAERNSVARMNYLSEGQFRPLVFLSMLLASRVTIQIESYRKDYPSYLWSRIVTISNPVFPATSQADPSGMTDGRHVLLSVGRPSLQKNFPVLVRVFADLAAQFPDWDLEIAGDGEDRAQVQSLIDQLGMGARIRLLGAVRDMSSLYARVQAFVLPSRWEGFPNALAEALAHGLPSVGFSECSGVRDLIVNGENGLLAEGMDNATTLSATLKILMADAQMRARMGQGAVRSMRPYEPGQIFSQWESLFAQVSGKQKR